MAAQTPGEALDALRAEWRTADELTRKRIEQDARAVKLVAEVFSAGNAAAVAS